MHKRVLSNVRRSSPSPTMKIAFAFTLLTAAEAFTSSNMNSNKAGFVLKGHEKDIDVDGSSSFMQSRKQFLNFAVVGASMAVSQSALADEGGRAESLDIDNFLRTGTWCRFIDI